MNWPAILKALKLAQQVARTKLVQGWRRIFAKNSADELKRRDNENADDIARRHGDV